MTCRTNVSQNLALTMYIFFCGEFVSLTINKKLGMCLTDVITTHLYGSLESEIYMKILEGFKMSEAYRNSPKICSIRL